MRETQPNYTDQTIIEFVFHESRNTLWQRRKQPGIYSDGKRGHFNYRQNISL